MTMFLHITACDHVGLCVVGSSSTFIVDATPPICGRVMVSIGKEGMFNISYGDVIVK